MQAALDEVRDALHSDDVDLAELVILGAREKVARLHREQHRASELRRRLAQRIRVRDIPVDVSLADEVRHSGWTRR